VKIKVKKIIAIGSIGGMTGMFEKSDCLWRTRIRVGGHKLLMELKV
jgi:hypothetical protein